MKWSVYLKDKMNETYVQHTAYITKINFQIKRETNRFQTGSDSNIEGCDSKRRDIARDTNDIASDIASRRRSKDFMAKIC